MHVEPPNLVGGFAARQRSRPRVSVPVPVPVVGRPVASWVLVVVGHAAAEPGADGPEGLDGDRVPFFGGDADLWSGDALRPAVAKRDPGEGGYLAAIARAGISMRTVLTVGGRMPLPEEATALQLGPGSPLLVLWRVTHNREDDRPVEATRYLLDAGGWEVTVPLADRRGPLAGTTDPGPAPELPDAGPHGYPEPAHEDDLSDDG